MPKLPFPSDATYLSVKEVAAFLRVDRKTIRRWIASDRLPATKLGRDWRIARADLKALAAASGNRGLADVL